MCLGVIGKIIKIESHKVIVKYSDESRTVLLGDEKVKIGDYVIVQMGIVVKVLSEKKALQALKVWKTD